MSFFDNPVEYLYGVSKLKTGVMGQPQELGLITVIIFALFVIYILWHCKGMKTNNDIKWLLWSALGIFIANIFIGTRWFPDASRSVSHMFGIVKAFVSFILSVAPIALSLVFCNKFWEKMEIDIENKIFSSSIYPTLMVAQGTFYTFVGVASILLTYGISEGGDTSMLLSGLKLAFFTSVIGLLYSIAAKMYIKQKENEYKEKNKLRVLDENDFYNLIRELKTTQNNIYSVLYQINSSQKENNQTLEKILYEGLDNNNKILQEQMRGIITGLTSNIEHSIQMVSQNLDVINKGFTENLIKVLESTNRKIILINDKLDKTCEFSARWNEENQKILTDLESISDKYNRYSIAQLQMLDKITDSNSTIGYATESIANNISEYTASMYKVSNNANDILDGFSKFNDGVSKLEKHIQTQNLFMDNAVKELTHTSKEVRESSNEIIQEYKNLNKLILENNVQNNLAIKEEQKKYAENIENITVETIKIVGEALRLARDEYKKEIKDLHSEIANIKKDVK